MRSQSRSKLRKHRRRQRRWEKRHPLIEISGSFKSDGVYRVKSIKYNVWTVDAPDGPFELRIA